MSKIENSRVLVISDLHVPYQHQDAIKFLTAVKKKYKPTRVVCVGDEIDNHAMSFHDSDPDLFSAGDELQIAIKQLQPLYKLFPKVDVLSSNHGDMAYRKGRHHGIPRKFLKDYGDVIDAPKGWEWHGQLRLKSGENDILFKHQFKKNILQSAQAEGCCTVAGHFHEDFSISYAGNSYKLLFGMTVGCLVDDRALAFEYNKTFAKRPILGIGIIINGQPHLIPMVLDKNGRWNKEVH